MSVHWKQEKLIDVVNVIENNMGLNKTSINDYVLKNEGVFYGIYYSVSYLANIEHNDHTFKVGVIQRQELLLLNGGEFFQGVMCYIISRLLLLQPLLFCCRLVSF